MVGVVILVVYDVAPPQLKPPLRPVVKLTVLVATVVTTTCPLTQQQKDVGQEEPAVYEPSQLWAWTQPMNDRITNRTIYVCIFGINVFSNLSIEDDALLFGRVRLKWLITVFYGLSLSKRKKQYYRYFIEMIYCNNS